MSITIICIEMLGFDVRQDIDSIRSTTSTVKNPVWSSFVNNVGFRFCSVLCVFFCPVYVLCVLH